MRSSAPRPAVWIAVVAAAAAVARPATADSRAARELRRAGAAALEAGRLDEALALYERALGPERSDRRVWFDLCLVRYAAGDYGRALDACYRALPADEGRVVALLERIAAAMRASGVWPGRLIVPEPDERWDTPDRGINAWVSSKPPPEGAGAVRARDPEPAGAADLIAADRLEELRGPPPPLPYRVSTRKDDYRVGLDLSARGGLLVYAPDASPLVGGVRAEWRRREPGASAHRFNFAEYLHAIDGTGGIGAIGFGDRGGMRLVAIGLSVPWGRSEGRRDVLIPDHTLGLHGEIRIGVHREVMIDRSWVIAFEGGLVAGLNLGKAAMWIGDKLTECDAGDCAGEFDANPRWPLGHVMGQLGISFGFRGLHPRYDRADVFAPMGGS